MFKINLNYTEQCVYSINKLKVLHFFSTIINQYELKRININVIT